MVRFTIQDLGEFISFWTGQKKTMCPPATKPPDLRWDRNAITHPVALLAEVRVVDNSVVWCGVA